MQKAIVFVVAAAALCACNTTSNAPKTSRSPWIGRSVNAFFRAYGPPKSDLATSDGGKVFAWEGVQNTVYLTGWATTGGKGNAGVCKIRITADQVGNIVDMAPTGDLLQATSGTKCHDIIGSEPN